MHNFLRKLRLNNMNGKYFKYAAGEIFLVVIGILIALSINNWNESNSEAREEVFYLSKLKENLNQDLKIINEQNKKALSFIAQLEALIIETKNPNLDSFSVDLTTSFFWLASMVPETATWGNLQSTGKIRIIQNEVLTDSLYNYYNFFDNNVASYMGAIKQYTRETIAPFFLEFDDAAFLWELELFEKQPSDTKKPFDYGLNIKFRNICRLRLRLLSGLTERYALFGELAEGNIQLINETMDNL